MRRQATDHREVGCGADVTTNPGVPNAVRSPGEIAFRARQELANLVMFLRRPRAPAAVSAPRPLLPDLATVIPRLKGTEYAATVEHLAKDVCQHRFALLGTTLEPGPRIKWRRDHELGVESSLRYFRRVSYLDRSKAGDFKIVFEINRHQHLILLAQAYLLTHRGAYLDELYQQIGSWLDDNPFARGINWTSALEVAFRAFSWVWVFHWTGAVMPERLRMRLLESLHHHGCYIEQNLSVYFSANTHLLGEALVLHLLGRVFPEWPRSARWEERGHEIMMSEMETQVRDDGGYFEQSTHYHTYATDFFLFHKIVARSTTHAYDARLLRMVEMLHVLMGARGTIPLLGDDDGGRLFHPFGRRDGFARGTLAVAAAVFGRTEWLRRSEDACELAAWWIGDSALSLSPRPPVSSQSTLFRETGLGVLRSGQVSVIADVGPMGPGAAAHSHADALSITASRGSEEILIDAGTCSYIDQPWRDRFRGTAAHNTVRIDMHDQGRVGHPFQWRSVPSVSIRTWECRAERDYLDAECQYDGMVHRRVIMLLHGSQWLVVLDRVSGTTGEHVLEQFWHPATAPSVAGPGQLRIGSAATLVFPTDVAPEVSSEGEFGWRSHALRQREPAPLVRVARRGTLPLLMAAVLDFSGGEPRNLTIHADAHEPEVRYGNTVVRIDGWCGSPE